MLFLVSGADTVANMASNNPTACQLFQYVRNKALFLKLTVTRNGLPKHTLT